MPHIPGAARPESPAMPGLDTHILVRFLVADDEAQTQAVYRLFKEAETKKNAFFVSLPILLELFRVLESVYNLPRREILEAVNALTSMPFLKVDSEAAVRSLPDDARKTSCDLSDLLIGHAAAAQACDTVLSFDKRACRHPLFRLLR